MATFDLRLPVDEAAVRALSVGDQVRLYGVVVTARDAAHKYIMDAFIRPPAIAEADRPLHDELQRLWRGGALYHCGPVVARTPEGGWRFVAAGPTTSIREEPYEAAVIEHFGLRAIIGKGGMGPRTLAACHDHGAVYLHAIGGAATLIARTIVEVVAVHKDREFGVPEAFWVVRADGLPTVVTMDSHGVSLHERVAAESSQALAALLA